MNQAANKQLWSVFFFMSLIYFHHKIQKNKIEKMLINGKWMPIQKWGFVFSWHDKGEIAL